MKFNKVMIVGIFLLAIFAIGAVSAADDIDTTDDVLAIDSVDEIEVTQGDSGELLSLAGDSSGEILERNGSSTVDSHFYGTTMTELSSFIGSSFGGDVIYFENDIEQDGTTFIMINKQLTLNGNGHSIDLKGLSYAFRVHNGNATLMNMIIKNGQTDNGGAIYSTSAGYCTLINCTFINNRASNHGGAVYLYSPGDSYISDCIFINNTAVRYGGAIYALNQVHINNCTFSYNTGECGGAVYSAKGNSSIVNSDFTSNAGRHGAAAYVNGSNINYCNFSDNIVDDTTTNGARGGALYLDGVSAVNNCTFVNNRAKTVKGYGGAIYFKKDCTIENCEFIDNAAGTSGGAVYVYTNATSSLTNCDFTNNQANINESAYGGAFYADGQTTLNDCRFNGNTAINTGGAVYLARGLGDLTDCEFNNNAAGTAGAVYSYSSSNFNNCVFNANSADSCGGYYGDGALTDCNFTDNRATVYDAGAIKSLNNVILNNCIFNNNTANRWAGTIYGSGEINDCTFINSHATYEGGAIYLIRDSNINNCIFDTTTSGRDGAAIYSKENFNVTDCTFVNCASGRYGGAMCNGTAYNCYFVNCSATSRGSAIDNGNAYDSTFINCYNKRGIVYNGTSENCIFAESPVLYCPDMSVNYGETITVPVRILDKDGNDVNGLAVDVKVYDGNQLIDSFASQSGSSLTLDVDAGSYIIALTSNYVAPCNASLVVNVPKPSPFISAPAVTTKYGNDVNITVYLASDVPGNVKVTINGATQKAPIKNGVATYLVSGLNYGLYPVVISYGGNYKYAADTINTTLKVNKNTPITSIVANRITHPENATITVNLAKGVPGNVKITVNGVTKKAKITNKVAFETFSGLKAGTYEVTVNYAGNVNFVAQTKTATLTVAKGTPILSVSAPSVSYGTSAVVSVDLCSDVPGNVKVTINGVTEKAPIKNGKATYTVPVLKAGSYEVTVNYAGNVNYNAQTVTTTLTIAKANPITSVSVKNINVGDTATVTIKMANNVNGNVKITVNGVTEKVPIVNGVATLNVTGLKAGTYDVSAYYAGNANFKAQTKTTSFTVSKSSPGLSFTAVTKSGKTTVTANIAQDAPGNVKIIVDGVTVDSAKITNGVATYVISGLASGTHTIKVTYGGNYKYTTQSRTKTITI